MILYIYINLYHCLSYINLSFKELIRKRNVKFKLIKPFYLSFRLQEVSAVEFIQF